MLNFLNLLDFLTSLELQTFLKNCQAVRALHILVLTSTSAPSHPITSPPTSRVSTVLPKQVKELTSSRGCSATVTGLLLACCILMIFVLPMLTRRPILADVDSRHTGLSYIYAWLWDRSVRLSAKSRSSNRGHSFHHMPFPFLPVEVIIIRSTTGVKRKGDSKHPRRTPVLTSKLSESCLRCTTLRLSNLCNG